MPVRSSVCTYSPSTMAAASSKHASSSLSVGHYKPLASSSSYLSSCSSTGSSPRRVGEYGSSRPHYTHSSASAGLYRPSTSGSPYSSFSGATISSGSRLTPTSGAYSRYSLASSTGSSISSASSLASSDYSSSTSAYSSSSSYNSHSHYPASSLSSSLRRLSYTSQASSSSLDHQPKLPSEVPKGLMNLGNTCYMNAVIQALYSIDLFREFILHASSSHTLDKPLTSSLRELFASMRNESSHTSGSVSPASFKRAFSRYQAKFSGLGQQDTQEFLRYLINGVHEESNQAARRPRASRFSGQKAPKSAQEAWLQYRDIVDDSPLVDVLVGQLCSTIVCLTCQNQSHCWDPFWDLSLPLVRGRRACRLSDLVADFEAPETLDGDERPTCGQCKRPTRSTKQISVCRFPQVMILHLKKFTNDGYKLTSAEVKIDQVLTLNNSKQQITYKLFACISHHGHSSSSGHYTSHCKYASRWFHFNDDRVRDVTSSFDSTKLTDAYVLFYTQQSPASDTKYDAKSS